MCFVFIGKSYRRGGGVGRGLGVGPHLPVHGVGVGVRVGVAVGVGVGVGPAKFAQYLPPSLRLYPGPAPPQMIISLPVQTAVWANRSEGALVVLVALQLSVSGAYLPPVPGTGGTVGVGVAGGVGGGSLGVGAGAGADAASDLAPLPKKQLGHPPHTIISLPVQTAV